MKSLVVVIVFLFLMKVFTEKAFAATKKKVQIVGIGVISINTDNHGNRREVLKKIRRLLITSNRLCYPNNLLPKHNLLKTKNNQKTYVFFFFFVIKIIIPIMKPTTNIAISLPKFKNIASILLIGFCIYRG